VKLINRIQGDDIVVIEIQEDNLDASNVREFREEMQKLIKDKNRVVLDMSALKFVDSSGLGALISCLRDTNSRKGDFRLSSLSRSVLALFELMRMHRVFSIHDNADSAVSSYT
jgi:anti-sigma B factor antagonist